MSQATGEVAASDTNCTALCLLNIQNLPQFGNAAYHEAAQDLTAKS